MASNENSPEAEDSASCPAVTYRLTVAEAALLSPPYGLLSYTLPQGFPEEFWQSGLRLAVPLGRGLRAAVLCGLGSLDVSRLDYQLKEIAWPLEQNPLLSAAYLDFARQFALRQALPLGRVLAGMLPAGLRKVDLRLRFFSSARSVPGKAEVGGEAPGRGRPQDFKLKELARLEPARRKELAALWAAGSGRVLKSGESLDEEYYSLKVAPPWPVRPSAGRQLRLLDFLSASRQATRRGVIAELGPDFAPVLKQLVARGLVEHRPGSPAEKEEDRASAADWLEKYRCLLETPPPFALAAEQRAALEDMAAGLEPGGPSGAPFGRPVPTHLLYGVTGSGKTAVYLELAARTLLAGKSVLLLAPEVALALKLRRDVQERFPGLPVHFFHGYQPPAAREACFRTLAGKSGPALVVGTRSALFLELRNLGAVILDEEHDSSFKQDERINYQAKDLAWYRAGQSGAVLLLGSATPDLKTYYAAEQGNIRLHRLDHRVGGGELPEIVLSPLFGKRGSATASGGILTDESSAALGECVARGEQAVILLNRRGYAPIMFCLGCSGSLRCPNCETSLTYHKKREKLVCHYCGYSLPFPSPCPTCKSTHYLPLGEGTEKLEERLHGVLPAGTRILRLDRDSTGRPGAMEEILRAFGRGEADVLVGTQMLSKGHHFPQVTLAIVADGDLGLNLPDYNAAERTFQLLVQAAGRSGRGGKKGRVIIQTRDPSHYCWEYVRQGDYEGFYRQELERRRRRRYPPFVRLALVRTSFPLGWAAGHGLLADLGKRLQALGKSLGVTVLGPAPAPYQLRDRRLRFQCLLKAADWQAIRGVYSGAVSGLGGGDNFRVSLDLDPASMM